MILTDRQQLIDIQVIYVFESGSPKGNYAALAIFDDGPHRIRQITFGAAQFTEFGGVSPTNSHSNLDELVQAYVDGGGVYSDGLIPYLDKIGVYSLVDDSKFKDLLLKAAKEDPVMKIVQDDYFKKKFFDPAMQWADEFHFVLPLSSLIILDSFNHSGQIFPFLRARFPEMPPALGGDEKTWDKQYIDARRAWLENNTNPNLPPTVYRADSLLAEIERDNWNFDILPVVVKFPHSTVSVFGD